MAGQATHEHALLSCCILILRFRFFRIHALKKKDALPVCFMEGMMEINDLKQNVKQKIQHRREPQSLESFCYVKYAHDYTNQRENECINVSFWMHPKSQVV